MRKFNYDSYCGLYCGACSILKAYQNGARDPMAAFWSDEAGLELQCHGCKTDQVFGNCAMCKIRSCARELGVERCSLCQEFPCSQFEAAEMQGLLEFLPHLSTVSGNMNAIAKRGIDAWLAQQEKQWQCPDCKTGYSWYAQTCSKCGKDLNELKGYKNVFDKRLFQGIK